MNYTANYGFSKRTYSKGLHAHDYYEFLFHIQGARYYFLDDTTYEMEPNLMIIIPPLQMHGLVCDRDLVDYERCYLNISAEELQKFGMGDINLIKTIEHFCQSKNHPIRLKSEDILCCKEYIQDIISGNLTDMEKNLKVMTILTIAMKAFDDRNNDLSFSSYKGPMPDLLHYLNNHYNEDIKIEMLAEKFHLSVSSLSHQFKAYANNSIYDYILNKRILTAKELLFSEQSLTDIAVKTGFNDYSNFLRAFKKVTGKTPKEFRNSL